MYDQNIDSSFSKDLVLSLQTEIDFNQNIWHCMHFQKALVLGVYYF